MMKPSEIALNHRIYLGTVGSTVHGLHLEGQDDRDEMGIAIEPPDTLIGLGNFETHVERTQPEGVRSGPGDLDRVVYSARKYAGLAAQGNPTVLTLLYTKPTEATSLGHWFMDSLRLLVATQSAGPRFLGYLISQRQKLTGERGGKRVKRPELEAAHGYDTKFAMHALRLGMQGIEFLTTGRMTLPMREFDRLDLMRVRRGEVNFDQAIQMIDHVENNLREAMNRSSLPEEPNRDEISHLLKSVYFQYWGKP